MQVNGTYVRSLWRNGVAAVVIGVALLTACGPPTPGSRPEQFLGQPLSEVYHRLNADPDDPLPVDFGDVLYGLSGVAGPPASSAPRLGRPPADWVVVVSSANVNPASEKMAEAQVLVLGIVPRAGASAPILERARRHDFDDRVAECAHRVPTIVPPAEA